jgi:hypothetical protein
MTELVNSHLIIMQTKVVNGEAIYEIFYFVLNR